MGGALVSRRGWASVLPAIVVVTLLVGVLSALAVARAVGGGPSRCDRFATAATERRAQDHGTTGPRVVVLGDSYSVGLGLDRPRESWPSRLPGRVHVDGFSGSGFSAGASGCGSQYAFAGRARRAVRGGADLVVVEGGLNDWDLSDDEITRGFDRLVPPLRGVPVLVVGPAAAPSRIEAVAHLDRLLRDLTRLHHVSYLPMSGLRLDYLRDDLHLTPSGHRAFGDRVADAVTRLLD